MAFSTLIVISLYSSLHKEHHDLLLYFDDIILTVNDHSTLCTFTTQLSTKFFFLSASSAIYWGLKPHRLPMACSYLKESKLLIFFSKLICTRKRNLVHHCFLSRCSSLMIVPLVMIRLNIIMLDSISISLLQNKTSAMSLIS